MMLSSSRLLRRQMLTCLRTARSLSSKTTSTSAAKPSSTVSSTTTRTVVLVSVSLATGYVLGRASSSQQRQDKPQPLLPSGLPRTCCDDEQLPSFLTPAQRDLPGFLKNIVGDSNVLVENNDTKAYTKGMRISPSQNNQALCVVTPRLLHDVVKCVEKIVEADCTVLVQGANTGLTGGSVPRQVLKVMRIHNRPTVIISTQYLDTIFPLDNGKRVVCLAGAGFRCGSIFTKLFSRSRIAFDFGKYLFESHSVGRSGIGIGWHPSCRKGSSYTDRAMYLTVSRNKWGELSLNVVNTLGIAGIEDDDFYSGGRTTSGSAIQQLDIYCRGIQQGYQRGMATSSSSEHGKAKASDVGYAERLCQVNEEVSRYNADTRGCDCNRSEGKVLILATVHDTFPKPLQEKSFWISFDSLETALEFKHAGVFGQCTRHAHECRIHGSGFVRCH